MKKHNHELEIDEHPKLEKKSWTAQRVGWFLMFLVIVAALLGFTGRGGLAGLNHINKSTSSQSLQLEYNKFQRDQVTDELKIKLQQLQTPSSTITFSKAFYEKMRVVQVVPEPDNVEINANEIKYTFNISQPEGSIIFYTKPMHVGSLYITVKGPDQEPVPVSMFVYP